MKKSNSRLVAILAAAIFVAGAANAETYYLKSSTAGTWTTFSAANIWTNAAGTAVTVPNSDVATYKNDDFIVEGGRALRTYDGNNNSHTYFNNKSLQISGIPGGIGRFIMIGSQLNGCNVVLKANGALYFYGRGNGNTAIGSLSSLKIDSGTTESMPAILEPLVSWNYEVNINCPITGSGWLNIQNYLYDTASHAAKTVVFYQSNSGYTGNFYLRGKSSSNMVYVKADHASSFAGNPETFAPKGLRMSNAKLTVVNGNTLPVNRGLYIGAASAIETTDAMTVNSAFAFENASSTLTKSGSQTLKLAGGVQEGSAAGIFNITAGTLDIAGSDTVEADFRGSATLKASGSAVVKPLAASTFSGALNATETSTIDLSAAPQFSPAITCASGTSLVLPALGGSVAKAGSFSATGPVVVTVGDGSPLEDGAYEILNADNSITAATIANLSCANAASSGGRISFMSFGGKVLYLAVGNGVNPDMYVYQGGGASGFFSDAGNWLWGQIPTNGGERVVIAATGTITNDLGEAFRPLAIEFSSDNTALAQIYGDKIEFQPGGSIINHPPYGADFYAEVDFGDSPIDVSCPGGQRVSFKTMATGTHTVNHTVFWGNYTITADTWVLTTPITLGTYATVTAKNVTAAVATAKSASIINTQEGSILTVNNLTFSNNSADYRASLVGNHKGTLLVKGTAKVSTSVQAQLNIWSGSGSCTGAICVNKFEYSDLNASDLFNFNVPDVVFGSGGLVCTRGRLYWSGKPLTWHSMADVSIGSIDYLSGNYNSSPTALKALAIDTTDWFDNAIGRTVTMTDNWKCSYSCPLSAFGVGTNVYNVALDKFTGGFTASNGVTVVLKSGARPGNGAVTMKGGTTLAVASSVTTGVIGGSGAVKLEADSVLAFNFSSTETAPVLAFNASSTLAPLPASGSVKVKITSNDGLNFNFGDSYTITSGSKFPADAVLSGKVVLSDDSAGWARLAVVDGNLQVSVAQYFYIKIAGSAGDKDINLFVPKQWFEDNGVTATGENTQGGATALVSNGDNDIPVWQSYCLGLSPTNAESVVLCDVSESQPSDGTVNFTAKNLNVPVDLDGVKVTAYLDSCTAGGSWSSVATNTLTASGPVTFTSPELREGISFFV